MDVFPLRTEQRYDYASRFNKSHRGIDIFAPRGTLLVAVEAGKARAAEDPKGGHVVYLDGQSGTQYYYAHLDATAPAFTWAEVLDVKAGDVIGYLGNTGNARTTPPHLHFQIKLRGGGPVIDPYDELVRTDPKKRARVGPAKPVDDVGAALALLLIVWLSK